MNLVVGGESSQEEADLVFVVGTRNSDGFVKLLEEELSADPPRLPDTEDLHPEGFAVVTGTIPSKEGTGSGDTSSTRGFQKNFVLIEGCDGRGTIYGVGHVLRSMAFLEGEIVIPPMRASERPARRQLQSSCSR